MRSSPPACVSSSGLKIRDAGIVDQRIEPAEALRGGQGLARQQRRRRHRVCSASVLSGSFSALSAGVEQLALDIQQRDAIALAEKALWPRQGRCRARRP